MMSQKKKNWYDCHAECRPWLCVVLMLAVCAAAGTSAQEALQETGQKQATPLAQNQLPPPELFSVLTAHLSPGDITVLKTSAALTTTTRRGQRTRLHYALPIKRVDTVRKFVENRKPTILYETLYFIGGTGYDNQTDVMTKIYNSFRNINELSDIRYRNQKQNVIYPIFNSSYQVFAQGDTEPLPDPEPITMGRRPRSMYDPITVLQDMPPFGDVFSHYEYIYGNNAMMYRGENITPIFYKKIQAVKPRDMLSAAYIIRTDEGVLVYGIGAVRVSGLAALFRSVIANSFESRMIGLFDWVKNRYEGKPQLE